MKHVCDGKSIKIQSDANVKKLFISSCNCYSMKPNVPIESKSMKQNPTYDTKFQVVMHNDKKKLDQVVHGMGDDTCKTISM
jgi:hypothetical protein